MQNTITIPTRPKRRFVPENLIIDSWHKIKFLFDDLVEREISSATELEKWMLDQSELAAVLEEDMAWRYIKMNIDTTDKELAERFSFWIKESDTPKKMAKKMTCNMSLLLEKDFTKFSGTISTNGCNGPGSLCLASSFLDIIF